MKYSFNIQASDDKQEYTEKLIIGAFSNEGGDTIALKLLAYLMFIKKRPRLDEDAGLNFIPDLIARDDAGEITLMVDCGSVSTKKADSIATKVRDRVDFFVFRKTVREMDEFYKTIQDKVKHLENINCVSFDDGFVDAIGANFDRTNNLEAYVGDEMVTITMDNSFGKYEGYSTIHHITGN